MTRVIGLALVFVFSMSSCDEPPPPDLAAALGSKVELVSGDVWMAQKEGKKRLITGSMLPEKAEISVGTGGRALVRLGTGAGAFLKGGTEAAIDGGAFTLKTGELWADVPAGDQELGRFAVAEVKVTASDAGLDIEAADGVVKVYVARGLAVVAAPGGRVEVQSGERATVKGGDKPRVEPVDFWEDWTGGMADRTLFAGIGGKASGRIYGIDRMRPGSPPEELQILSQDVRVVIREGIAQTTVDQRFFNPSGAALEGWYWFTIPEGASVQRFALYVNGVRVDGEMVERKQAAAAYEEAVQRAFDPALLEWIDGRTFRARIFPIPAAGERRVEISYFEVLPLTDGVYRYVYPMASAGDLSIQEFSLNVDLGDDGKKYQISTLEEAKVEKDSAKISMRRSGFKPRADFLLELRPTEKAEPLRAMRYSGGDKEADYIMLRYAPEVDWGALDKVPGDVVVVLDTSAGGEDSDRQIKADAVEAVLRALSAGDRFAVLAADLSPRVVYPAEGLAQADEKNVSQAVEKLAEVPSAGATDLGEMFSKAFDLLYGAEQPAVVYVGDGLATVGETSSNDLADRLRRALGDSRTRLFTIAVGAEANHALLDRLASVGGGRSFRINTSDQTVQEALKFVGMLKTPTITDMKIDVGSGLDQVFSTAAGKLSEGDEVVMLARTHHALPDKVNISWRLGGKDGGATYDLDEEKGSEFGYIPILWARQYLTSMMGEGVDEARGRIISLGLSYSIMTPFTSFLVLESDAAYMQQGIQRRPRYFSDNFEADRPTEVASASDALSIPLGLFGCMSRDEAPVAAEQKAAGQGAFGGAMDEEARSIAPAPSPASQPVAAAPTEAEEVAESAGKRDYAPQKSADGDELNDLLGGSEGTIGLGNLTTIGVGGGGGTGSGYGKVAAARPKEKSRRAEDKRESVLSRLATAGPAPDVRLANALIASGNLDGDETPEKPFFKLGVCSDSSSRPLWERRILWSARLNRVTQPYQYFQIFLEAGERCELPAWRDRKVMLDLIESRVNDPSAVQGLLASFGRYPAIQKYLRHRILRRTLDPNATMGLRFPDVVNWHAVLTGLAALKTTEARMEELKRIMAKNPTDPVGRGMLVQLLVELGMKDEAMAEASRLRRDGLASPDVMEILCDLQAASGQLEEARRACSELVEFNAEDPSARQRLGDLFLRHGWYEEAYRQYLSLVAMLGDSAAPLLRLAAAAAGMGKVDEALRIERKVASGDGEPGAGDPRRWARLHSAARLAEMLMAAREEKKEDTIEAMERSLKRTQVFGQSSTIAILVWEDFDANLKLTPKRGDDVFTVSEQVLSPQTGLAMIDLGQNYPEDLRMFVDFEGKSLGREVPFTIYTITWDGKNFTIDKQEDKTEVKKENLAA